MNWNEVLPTIIAAAPASVVSIISVIILRRNHKQQMINSDNKAEILKIEQSLHDFYYPYLVLAKENTALYNVFSKPYKDKDPGFRTLAYLLEKKDFNANDNAMLQEIIENDIKLNKLISERANVVDDEELRSLLVKSSTHYTIIALAYNKKINGEVNRFESYVHPNEVYLCIEKKTQNLEKRLIELKNGN